MRNVITYLLLFFLLQACQQKPAETTGKPIATLESPAASISSSAKGTLAQQFSPIISGCWVSAQYLDAVRHTRSPEAASESMPDGPVAISIKLTAPTADSTQADILYNMHEGGILPLTIIYQAGQSPNSLLVKRADDTFSELAYQISPVDTSLFLVARDSKTKKETKRIAYQRIAQVGAKVDPSDGVDYSLNELLVAGRYFGTDSLGKPLKVAFLPTGKVIGLPFRTYFIHADFFAPSIGDELIFDSLSKGRQELAASYGRDTLRLYTIHVSTILSTASTASMPIDSITNFSCGRLRYQLVRTRKP